MIILNRKFKKLICIALFLIFLCCMITSSVNAKFASEEEFDGKTAIKEVDTAVNNTAVMIISVARVVGAAIAIIMLFAIAIKYMVSSAGDRADIKKHAVAYVVGAVILFGAVGVLGAIQGIADKIGDKS